MVVPTGGSMTDGIVKVHVLLNDILSGWWEFAGKLLWQ